MNETLKDCKQILITVDKRFLAALPDDGLKSSVERIINGCESKMDKLGDANSSELTHLYEDEFVHITRDAEKLLNEKQMTHYVLGLGGYVRAVVNIAEQTPRFAQVDGFNHVKVGEDAVFIDLA